ncbi:MAG: hypothetical protein ACRDT4_18630 [Micromonosporaceae bacterium]
MQLLTDQTRLLGYLDAFYDTVAEEPAGDGWLVDARLGPGDGMARDAWGVARALDAERRVIRLRADDVDGLAVTVRKCLREAMVDYCERRGYTMLHASAFADADRAIVVVGDKGSGKTTLALRACLLDGFRYIANDHLIAYMEGGGLVLTSLPTLIPVKVGTFLDLEALLPKPWDCEGVDVDAYRGMPAAERYRHQARLLYTYRQLGQPNPVTIRIGEPAGPRLAVVFARYGQQPQVSVVSSVQGPDALMEHVRTDWMFNPNLNQRYLARDERGAPQYLSDARGLVEEITRRADVLTHTHRGEPGPLLAALNEMWTTS